MKRHVVLAAIVISLGAFVAAVELTVSRAQVKAYGPHVATPFGSIVFGGAALIAVALALLVLGVIQERRRLARHRTPRRRRGPRRSSEVERLLPSAPARPVVTMPAAVQPVSATTTNAVVATAELMSAEELPTGDEATLAADGSAPSAVEPLAEVVEPAVARWPADPLHHWGLREPAFDNAPTTRFLYRSPAHTEALFRLRYAIHHRKGGAILIGNYGCGKTTLARALARELDASRFDVVLIANPLLTPIGLLQEMLHQLGVTSPPADRPALLHALEGRLVENLRRGRDTVLIVDEAIRRTTGS